MNTQDLLALGLQKTAARQDALDVKLAAVGDMLYKLAESVDAVANYVEAKVDSADGATPTVTKDSEDAGSSETAALVAKLEEDIKLLTEDETGDGTLNDVNLEVSENDPKLVGTASLNDILDKLAKR